MSRIIPPLLGSAVGGGGGGYVAKAVQIVVPDQNVGLLSSAVPLISKDCMLFSTWIRSDLAALSGTALFQNFNLGTGFNAQMNPVDLVGDMSTDMSDAAGFGILNGDYGPSFNPPTSWKNYIFSAQCSTQTRSCAIGGIVVPPDSNDQGWVSHNPVGYADGELIAILSNFGGTSWTVELADMFHLLSDTYYDLTDPSVLARFISNGKPVNPSGFPSGGLLLLSGDASANGFRKNVGTWGDIFALTGTLTNASTSPSD